MTNNELLISFLIFNFGFHSVLGISDLERSDKGGTR